MNEQSKSEKRRVQTQAPIDDGQYRIDLELLDRYVAFSAEIVRLSLASLAGLGFGISLFAKSTVGQLGVLQDTLIRDTLMVGVVLLCFAVGFALAHRYFATDGFSDHARALRELAVSAATDIAKADKALERRAHFYRLSGWSLAAASIALPAGIVCLGAGLIVYLTQL